MLCILLIHTESLGFGLRFNLYEYTVWYNVLMFEDVCCPSVVR